MSAFVRLPPASWTRSRAIRSRRGALVTETDAQHALDLERLDALREAYAVKAAAYFRKHAADWSRVRALHVDQEKQKLLCDVDVESPQEEPEKYWHNYR